MNMKIQARYVVTLRHLMQNSKGEVLENSMNGPAISYIHGEGKILPGLEAQLEGLCEGERKYIRLHKAEYLGLDDDFNLQVVIDHVRPASTEELAFGIVQPAGEAGCGQDCNCHNDK